ncbi:hypothetical protein D9M69_513120 [compost metagenome]
MAVTQVGRQAIEDEHHVSHAKQGITADFPTTGVPEDPGKCADADDIRELFDHLFQKVHAAGRRRHQHGRRMMDFVEGPQIPRMESAMAPVMAEILDQKYAQPIEQGQRQVLFHLRTRAPQLGEERDVVR